MNKRTGMEGLMGVGRGMVSQESQQNLAIAEDLCRKKKPEMALPYLMKAMEDPNNLDADIQFSFLQPNLDMSLQVLEDAERRGHAHLRRVLGPRAFDDNGDTVGNFWGIVETRPYMRVLQAYPHCSCAGIPSLRCYASALGITWVSGHGSALSCFKQVVTPMHSPSRKHGCSPSPVKQANRLHEEGVFTAPSRSALSQADLDNFSEYADADLLYTAALAAYRLWGDCLLARQYLRLGARNNFVTLMRILGKVQRPESLNNMPRTFNSSEHAHDYLWLTQNLWMEPDVWGWADGDKAKSYVLKTCSRDGCGQREEAVTQFKRCSACKRVSYCSHVCRKADWTMHKPACKQHERMKEMSRAIALGRPAPTGSEGDPLVASADFSSAGISTTFHN